MNEQPHEIYNDYFPTKEEKASAFDKIAERYYFANFGTMSKSDLETLLFSIYLEQILDREESKIGAYSDYRLSKLLGVPQSKISTLKVKKQLSYPYGKFNWQESLKRISSKAVYEDGKIKLFIPDRNLYLEVKNAIETYGGFVEVQLTANLLQVKVNYFLDLMVAISEDREKIRKELRAKIKEQNKDIALIENESFGQLLKRLAPEVITELIGGCIPVFGGAVKVVVENVWNTMPYRQ